RRAHAQRRQPHLRDVLPRAQRHRRPGHCLLHPRGGGGRGGGRACDHRRHLPAPAGRHRRRRPAAEVLSVDARDLPDLGWVVPALPALGAAILLLFGRRLGEPKAGLLATGLMALAFGWSVVMLVALRDVSVSGPAARTHTVDLFTWFPTGGLQVKMGF